MSNLLRATNREKLTTLTFHYETQPLPTPAAWYPTAALWFKKSRATVMFYNRAGRPVSFFGPEDCVSLPAGGFGIHGTHHAHGELHILNFLTLALCLTLLDDRR